MRFLSLLCYVSFALFVKSGNLTDSYEEIFKNRKHLANGFNGFLPPLDPLHINSFTIIIDSSIGQIKEIIHSATLKGFTSFDEVKNNINEDGSFRFEIHVSQIKLTADYTDEPAILNVESGTFSGTLNDVQINIAGNVSVDHVNSLPVVTFRNVHVQIEFHAPTTNMELKGENITEEYIKLIEPLLISEMGSLLEQVCKFYQSEISTFVTDYLNELSKLINILHR